MGLHVSLQLGRFPALPVLSLRFPETATNRQSNKRRQKRVRVPIRRILRAQICSLRPTYILKPTTIVSIFLIFPV